MTKSDDYPTTGGAVQPVWGGNQDGFITRISEGGAPPPGNHKVFLPFVVR